jgi:hypothetical protein
MNDPDPIQQLFNYALRLAANGQSPKTIQQTLIEQGIEEQTAAHIAQQAVSTKKAVVRKAALAEMGIGVGICLVGLIITLVTLALASGGGTYVVAYGAILVGAFQFLRGVFRLLKG